MVAIVYKAKIIETDKKYEPDSKKQADIKTFGFN
jgi:hypothetical protein